MMRALLMFAGVLAAELLACPGVFPASITYDEEKNCVLVSGYSEESQANLSMVLEADRNGFRLRASLKSGRRRQEAPTSVRGSRRQPSDLSLLTSAATTEVVVFKQALSSLRFFLFRTTPVLGETLH